MALILKRKIITILTLITIFSVNVSGFNIIDSDNLRFEENISYNEEVSLYIFMIGFIENLSYFKQLNIEGYEFNCKNVLFLTWKPGSNIGLTKINNGDTDMILTYSDSQSDWRYKGYIGQDFIFAVQILKQL